MVIDIITERNNFVFQRFPDDGAGFSDDFFALCLENFFKLFTIKFRPINHRLPLNSFHLLKLFH